MEQVAVDWTDDAVETAVTAACNTQKGLVYVCHPSRFVLWTDNDLVWRVNSYRLNNDGTATLIDAPLGDADGEPEHYFDFERVQ